MPGRTGLPCSQREGQCRCRAGRGRGGSEQHRLLTAAGEEAKSLFCPMASRSGESKLEAGFTHRAARVRHKINCILLRCVSRGAPLHSGLLWVCIGGAETRVSDSAQTPRGSSAGGKAPHICTHADPLYSSRCPSNHRCIRSHPEITFPFVLSCQAIHISFSCGGNE